MLSTTNKICITLHNKSSNNKSVTFFLALAVSETSIIGCQANFVVVVVHTYPLVTGQRQTLRAVF